ncbi:MAG TPA: hypothetical protein VMS17_00275 [Gemmataceae bacterium]|nr:hypothetical protein [Gemmataceae bacterium]
MWSIIAVDALIAAVFTAFICSMFIKPKARPDGTSDKEVHELVSLLGRDLRKTGTRLRSHVMAAGQIAEAQSGDLPRQSDPIRVNEMGTFSLLGPYQRASQAMVFVMLFFTFILRPVWSLLFVFFWDQRLESLRRSNMAIVAPWSWLACIPPSFFLGLVSSFFLVNLVGFLVIGRKRFNEYSRLEYERRGAARTRAVSRFFLVLMVIIIIVVTLALNCYSRFDSQHIVDNWWGIGERTRSYGSIDKIVVTSQFKTAKGEVFSDKRLHIIFDDGEDWWCNWDQVRFGPSCRDGNELVSILSTKSGKPVTQAPFIEDVTGR